MRLSKFVVGICLLSLSLSSRAQQPSPSPAAATDYVPVPPEKLPPPIHMTNIGNSHLQITTANPEAQVWFDQGLNLLHDFWDYESVRAFEQSVRLDPHCAMCYWGLYQAEAFRGANPLWAKDALKQAAKLSRHAPATEKLYIKAAQQDAAARPKKGKNANVKEVKTLRKLVAAQPDDIQAKLFLSGALRDGFDEKGLPKPGTSESQTILQGILAAHPDDSAANHYWIHAMEPSLHPEAALDSAAKLGPLTPASGHMVHMPGHIYYRVGDYEKARLSFENSMHVDEAYMRTQHVGVDDDWNYVHNLMYLVAALLEAGRIQQATEMSAKLSAGRGTDPATLYRFSIRDGISRLDPELPVLLRSAGWAAATERLQRSHPAADLENLATLRTSLLDYTQGMQALANGDIAAAAEFSKDLDARVDAKPAEPSKPAMACMPGMQQSKDADAKPLHNYLKIAALELDGSVLLAQNKPADSDAAFVKAAAAEKDMGYREPPAYIRPVNEARGDALLRAKKYPEAKTAYQAALADRPSSGYPQFGIAEADADAGNKLAAREAYTAFLKDWTHADADLPQVKQAHAWLAANAGAVSNGQ